MRPGCQLPLAARARSSQSDSQGGPSSQAPCAMLFSALICALARPTLSADYLVSTLAGLRGVSGSADGRGTSASFGTPAGLVVDGQTEDLYIADAWFHNVRAVTGRTVWTLAGGGVSGSTNGIGTAALFNTPQWVSLVTSPGAWGAVALLVSDTRNHKIRRVALTGSAPLVTTLVGGGASGTSSGSTDGTGTAALFLNPQGICVDAQGAVYVSDGNHKIRLVRTDLSVVTLAGGGASGTQSGYLNALGTAALFRGPAGIGVDALGNVYVADSRNNNIRVVRSSGQVVTLLGGGGGNQSGFSGGSGTAMLFSTPTGLALKGDTGELLIADTDNNCMCSFLHCSAHQSLFSSQRLPPPSLHPPTRCRLAQGQHPLHHSCGQWESWRGGWVWQLGII